MLTIQVLVRRDFSATVTGLGLYAAISLSLIVSTFLLNNYLTQVGRDSILISSNPLNFPLYIALVVVSFYLALVSAVSISREKDQGTLEVLFYGPVNSPLYLSAKYIADMLVFITMAAIVVVYFAVVSAMTHLALSWDLMKAVLLSVFSASCIISFSLFISSLTSKMRASVVWLVAILAGFLAIQLFHGLLVRLDEDALSVSMRYLRKAVNMLAESTQWITPFSALNKGIQAITLGDAGRYAINILFSLVYSIVFLAASVVVLEKKGVRP